MSISIFDSRSVRTTSSAQDLLNDLAPILTAKWSDMTVIYDTTTPSNVAEIWVSDEVYISLSTNSTTQLVHHHKTLNLSQAINKSCAWHHIITTDTAILCCWEDNNNLWSFAISQTTSMTDGSTSYGVAAQSGTNLYAFTDGMFSTSATIQAMAVINNRCNSTLVNEQLVPFASIWSNDVFPNVYEVLARKTTTRGERILNQTDYFYVTYAFAVKYTP